MKFGADTGFSRMRRFPPASGMRIKGNRVLSMQRTAS
jgi:hypothetical protein